MIPMGATMSSVVAKSNWSGLQDLRKSSGPNFVVMKTPYSKMEKFECKRFPNAVYNITMRPAKCHISVLTATPAGDRNIADYPSCLK